MSTLPHGVCTKNGSIYRRFKVKEGGRWVDFYVKLPALTDPEFDVALARANDAAEAGEFGREIRIRA